MHTSSLANTSMVLQGNDNDDRTSCNPTTKPVTTSSCNGQQNCSPVTRETSSDCMSLIRGKVKSSSLSKPAQEILLASWRPGTLKQYDSYLHRWAKFCHDNEINVYQPRVEQVVEFLTHLFQTGLGYSAINTARSALSSIVTLGHVPLGEHPMIKRFLKGIFELRLSLPKYSSIWDVSILLLYLKKLAPLEKLSLKEISLKMTSLLCILTGQRCHTIHKIDISHTQQLPNLIRITIQDTLKTTNQVAISNLQSSWHITMIQICASFVFSTSIYLELPNYGWCNLHNAGCIMQVAGHVYGPGLHGCTMGPPS